MSLEAFDDNTNSIDNTIAFSAQMLLYGTLDALMCHTFPTMLRGSSWEWYARLKPLSVGSFAQLAKDFELNFLENMLEAIIGDASQT